MPRAQLKCIQREFDEVLKSEEGKDLYINTVDAFQGQERDVVIMSCVRASSHRVGFVADIRRMNVAITRAKRTLWVMGNASALVQSADWAALIADSKARKCYMDMDSLPKDFLVAPNDAPPSFGPPSTKFSNTRDLMRPGVRQRPYEHLEPRMGIPSGDDNIINSSSTARIASYRPFKPHIENSKVDFDWFPDAQQYKRQNSNGVSGKRYP